MKFWKKLKTKSERESICNAFPKILHHEVEKVLEILPIDNHNILSADGEINNIKDLIGTSKQTISLNNEILVIPYRIYFNEPDQDIESTLTDLQKTILNCIYLRHYNGFIRQKRLENLIGNSSYFVTPFSFQLLGEYVSEILEVLQKHITPSTIDNYANFIFENQKHWSQTESRMITFWDAYYRPSNALNRKEKKEARKEYVGQQIVDRLKKRTYNIGVAAKLADE